MSSNPNREEAISNLISALHRLYPTRGFLIHPSLRFVQNGGSLGIDVQSTTELKKGEVLLTVPESCRFSVANIPTAADCGSVSDGVDNGDGGGVGLHVDPAVTCCTSIAVQLRQLIDGIEFECERVLEATSEEHEYQMDSKEVALAVLVLYVRCVADRKQIKSAMPQLKAPLFPGNTTVKAKAWLEQSKSWPSLDEMRRDVPLCWEEDVRDILGKSFARDHMESNLAQLRAVFDGAVLPTLLEELGQEPQADQEEEEKEKEASSTTSIRLADFILPVVKERELASQREELWESIRYAYAIVYSRAHESVDAVPELIPLIDLLNGLSEVCKGGAINVDFASGKWPFIRGNCYENHCQLDCSALFVERDVKAKTSLIISYGCLTPSSFFVKYGTIPAEHLRHANMTDSINIWFPHHWIPDESTSIGKLRCIALKKGGYPLDAFRQGTIRLLFLPGDDDSSGNNPFAWYISGEELGVLETLQRMIALIHIADEATLQQYIVTGRIRCNFESEMLFSNMVGVLDHNLKLLSSTRSSSKSDLEQSKDPELSPALRAAYLARVCQRETLCKWRHAFCRRYMRPSHVDRGIVAGAAEIDFPDQLKCSACRVCGRTYPNHNCSKCKWRGEKSASYCCRAHQASDWRSHKRECQQEHK